MVQKDVWSTQILRGIGVWDMIQMKMTSEKIDVRSRRPIDRRWWIYIWWGARSQCCFGTQGRGGGYNVKYHRARAVRVKSARVEDESEPIPLMSEVAWVFKQDQQQHTDTNVHNWIRGFDEHLQIPLPSRPSYSTHLPTLHNLSRGGGAFKSEYQTTSVGMWINLIF